MRSMPALAAIVVVALAARTVCGGVGAPLTHPFMSVMTSPAMLNMHTVRPSTSSSSSSSTSYPSPMVTFGGSYVSTTSSGGGTGSGGDLQMYGNYSGDIILAAFFPVHRRIGGRPDGRNTASGVCGSIQEEDGIQPLEAFLYALDNINRSPRLLRGFRLGAVILDSCDDETHALQQAVDLIRVLMTRDDPANLPYRCSDGSLPGILPSAALLYKAVGVFGGSTSSVSIQLASLLKLFMVPQVSYMSTSPDLSHPDRYPFFRRTVPSDSYQARAILEILREFNWSYVSMIYEDSNYGIKGYGEVDKLAGDYGVCFSYVRRLDFDEVSWGPADYEGVIKGMSAKNNSQVAILWADYPRANALFQAADRLNKTDIIWIGSDAWSGRKLAVENTDHVVHDAITVQPLARKLIGFDEHFRTLKPDSHHGNPWFKDFWAQHFNCSWQEGVTNTTGEEGGAPGMDDSGATTKACTGREDMTAQGDFKEQLNIHFVSDAAYAFAHALSDMHRDLCGNRDGLCDEMKPDNISGDVLLTYLTKVKFTSASGDEFRFIDGMEGPPRYTVMAFRQLDNRNGRYGWKEVGTYSGVDGEGGLSFEPTFRETMDRYPTSVCSLPCGVGEARVYAKADRCCWVCRPCPQYSFVVRITDDLNDVCVACEEGKLPNVNRTFCYSIKPTYMDHSNPWAIASMTLALFLFVFVAMTACVFIVYYDTPVVKASGRELSFVLLGVVFLSFMSTFIFVAKPSNVLCGFTRILLGLCYTGIYASILAKSSRISRIFNDAAGSPKRARLTSPRSQLIIVFLLIFVEVLILAVWFAASPPATTFVFPKREEKLLICYGSNDASYLIALVYPFLLMLACLVYAFKTRKTPDGFNETHLITFTSYTTVVVWLAFIPLYFINQYNNEVRVTTLCVSLSLNGSVVLLCLFLPKVYICLFHPEKNTREAVMMRSQSVLSTASLPYANSEAVRAPDSPGRTHRLGSARQAAQTLDATTIDQVSATSSRTSPSEQGMRVSRFTQTDGSSYAPVYSASRASSDSSQTSGCVSTSGSSGSPSPQLKMSVRNEPEEAGKVHEGFVDVNDVTLEYKCTCTDQPGSENLSMKKPENRRVSIARLKDLPGIVENSSNT